MKNQVEDRLKYLSTGEGSNKNLDVMNEVIKFYFYLIIY
jgi:hypothetical protein